MRLEETRLHCQMPCLQLVGEDPAVGPPESLSRKFKLKVRRRLNPERERAIKNYTNNKLDWVLRVRRKDTTPPVTHGKYSSEKLEAGDWIRVRSLEEIEKTLNHWKQTKGCAFMPEMAKYCGTIHRVLKHMKSFVDERDFQVKRSKGIILLEGIRCEGTEEFGKCERACLHFWRQEWLEKIDSPLNSLSKLPAESPKNGKYVRVRSQKEIEATLNYSNQLKGCAFMPEMAKYCGKRYRVLNYMERFFDEHNLQIKNSSGIVLLDGVMCTGAAPSSSCDRTCNYLWREEWLQKVDE